MKYRTIVFIAVSCLFIGSCKRNFTPISDLIDIEKWDFVTMLALSEKLHLDTILKYDGEDRPPIAVMNDGTSVNNYEEEIRWRLSLREKIIKVLQEQKILSNEKTIYILEWQGHTTFGYSQSFTIYFGKKAQYRFEYNNHTDAFVKSGLDGSYAGYLDAPIFCSDGVYMGVLEGLQIITLIKQNNKNELSYKIVGIEAR
jgi:hypothetical protein